MKNKIRKLKFDRDFLADIRAIATEFKSADFLTKILYFAPIAIWFSYYPNFNFGRSEGANLEFSIALIYALFLALVALPRIWQKRHQLLKNRAVWLTFAFVLWNFLSFFISKNPLRTVLTAGVWGVLWLDFLAILAIAQSNQIFKNLYRILIFSAGAMSILAIIQVVYGAFTDWGLCRGCLAAGFGFVRPSVFAIEPQFFGNMLIAPILFIWIKFLSAKKITKFEFFNLFVCLIAIYLTLSRGAIFALIPAMILAIFIVPKSRLSLRYRGFSFFIIVGLSFMVGLQIHAIFTQLNPRVSDGFYDSISKSINQLSLGKISLPKAQPVEKPVENPPSRTDTQTKLQTQNSPQKASFDGYVEKSTDERTKLSSLALQTWQQNPSIILLGVGAGGAGKAILQITGQIASAGEIVQNEFLSILLELGLVGLVIWLAIWLGFIWQTRSNRLGWLILLAFMLQWFFFSGLPNALHIYLILAIFFAQNSAAKN